MLKASAIKTALKFIGFVSSLVGEAAKNAINSLIDYAGSAAKTAANTAIDYTIKRKLDEKFYNTEKTSFFAESFMDTKEINAPRDYFSFRNSTNQPAFVSNLTASQYRKFPTPILLIGNKKSNFIDGFRNYLDNINGISILSQKQVSGINLYAFPFILVTFISISENQVITEIEINRIIPGINKTHTLQLVFHSNNMSNTDFLAFNDAIFDYLRTIIVTLKDTFQMCRIPISESLHRLNLEAEQLSEMGYRDLNFKASEADGYDIALSDLFGADLLVHFSPEYPVVPPYILIQNRINGEYDEVIIPDNVWNDNYTICDCVRAIAES